MFLYFYFTLSVIFFSHSYFFFLVLISFFNTFFVYKLSPLPYLQIKKLKKKKKKNKASMLHYTCVVLALGFSVGQLARPNLCMSCAVWFVPATHTRRGVNEVLTLSYHLSSFFSLDFSPSFQGFLSSLFPPIFHSPQNILSLIHI